MYSTILGTHQRINRAARSHLTSLHDSKLVFPTIRQILKFEGYDGPDGIKRKSPSQDEPNHFYDPFDEDDTDFLETIQTHYHNLVEG
jgi:hypothetical protein